MTARELNRDFKNLYKRYRIRRREDTTDWTQEKWDEWNEQREEDKKELVRLYNASEEFYYANKLSIQIFIELNNRWRVIPFHQVYARITQSF